MRTRVGVVLAMICACGGGGRSPNDGGTDNRQPVVSVRTTPQNDVDLLFVIDDSASMADKQNNLAVNFPNFINVLNTIEGGLPNVHIGVTTTDMGTKSTGSPTAAPGVGTVGQGGCVNAGDDGKLQTNGAAVTGSFISDVKQTDGTRIKNYTGDLATVFGQMARVGATGCGFEQPLHAMKRALENTTANPGFLRPDAILGVVFLADEDDCTAKSTQLFAPTDTTIGTLSSFRCTRFGVTCTEGGATSDAMNVIGAKGGCSSNETSTMIDPVTPYRDFLLGLKTDPSKVVVGGIIGDPTPVAVETRTINGNNEPAVAHSCMYQGAAGNELADPGARFKSFFDLFPGRSAFTSICQPDLSVALEQLAQLISRTIGSPCITTPIADVDASMPGLQPDCVVEDVVGVSATVIPKCSSPEAPPCWRFDTDAIRCPSLDHLRLTIVRSAPADPATITNMRCVVL